jgi:alpha-L-rhamnosidase
MGKPRATVVIYAPHGSDVVIDPRPAIGWTTSADEHNWRQARADIELTRGGRSETATVDGDESVRLPWPFETLKPREHVHVRVRTHGEDGSSSEWSEPQSIFAGFLGEGEWVASAVRHASPAERAQPVYLRDTFIVGDDLRRATLYASAKGAYQAAINGTDVDDQVLKPGWTAYEERLIHETTDVTALLEIGENAIGVRLAGAWATERYGFDGVGRTVYTDQPEFAAQLILEYDDGRVQTVATGAQWTSATGALVSSGIYDGETYDARLEFHDADGRGYAQVGFNAERWSPMELVEGWPVPEGRVSPHVRAIEEVQVEEIVTTPSGRTILDFGQNIVGRVRIRVSGPSGHIITLRHAEVLENGELGTRPLRRARATDQYILAGRGEEIWEPEFTFHGFRYVDVDGWVGELDPADITAVVIHSDMRRTGWFDSSHPLVNQLHENVIWGLRGNFLYLPTDCPQRDERLGWTGDIQIFAPTASFLYDVRGFLDSWLSDLSVEQRRYDGVVPFVVPNVLDQVQPAAAWGDAATIVPSVLHERYGDVDTLKRQYPSMRDWADVLIDIAGESRLWEGGFQYGDWLDPDAPPAHPDRAKTAPDLVATAHLFRSTDLVARAARILGHADDAESYAAVAEEIRRAFLSQFVTPSGRMMSDAPTAYAVAIMFDIAPVDLLEAFGRRLAELTREAGYRIGTGFVGTPIVQDALTRTGHLRTAERLLLQTENPSWLYPVTMGATTVWERWDSMLPNGSINPGEMTSFNHYALGSVADWLHRTVAGLGPAESGYRTVKVAPRPLGGLTHARAEHITPYGFTSVEWTRLGGVVTVRATIPANADALVDLEDRPLFRVGSGIHEWQIHIEEEDRHRGAVDVDTPLAEIVEDEEAYRAIVRVLDEHSSDRAATLTSHLKWTTGLSLRDAVLRLLTPEARQEIEESLASLSATRIGGQ